MRLVTLRDQRGTRIAALRGDGIVDLRAVDSRLPASMKELLEQGDEGLRRAEMAALRGTLVAAADYVLAAPVPNPQKVICVGLNYADHARESGVDPPPEPVMFNKFPTAVAGPDEPIRLPAVSQEVDYEAELVVVIGRTGKNIPRAKAFEFVAGYCPGHDVSARDWQLHKPGKQWLLGKSFDTFAPFGPALVTPDEVPEVGKLRIALRLNGQTLQDSSTEQLIFPVDELIAYISQVCTLVPGDVIFTGTPPGVGFARKPPIFLKPGDLAEVEIERLGVLRNRVIADVSEAG